MTETRPHSPEELVIVAGCDNRYAMPLSVTLSSTLNNLEAERPVRVIVVDGGLTEDSRRRIGRVVGTRSERLTLDWHLADKDRFADLKTSKWGSTANYLRLLIPEIVAESVEQVLYLDSDLLVRSDVAQLSDLGKESQAPVLAVGDYHHRRCETVYGVEGCKRIGINPDSPYFNSGVLVIDVAGWRRDRVAAAAVEFVREHAAIMKHSDQDALNVVLIDQWKAIDDRWNVMVPSIDRYLANGGSTQSKRELLAQGKILHFTGARKPWLPGYVGPAGFEYRKTLRDSGWFDDNSEWSQWLSRFWASSPPGWGREGYRRARRRAAIAYRSLTRSTPSQ